MENDTGDFDPWARETSRPTQGHNLEDLKTVVVVNFTDRAVESTNAGATAATPTATSLSPLLLYPTCVYETHHSVKNSGVRTGTDEKT